MPKVIFLDTNVFLHYRDFDLIDWREVVQSDAVTIVIPPVTVRELNQQKDSSPRRRVKRRAANTIKKLYLFLESGSLGALPSGVRLCIEDRDPLPDHYTAHQLNWNVQDDQIIASIISYRLEFPNSEIVLITSDMGLTLVAKAKRSNISTIKLPESLKLPEEPDLDQERIRALEQENRELKQRIPQLSLTFTDGNQHTAFTLEKPVTLTPEEAGKALDMIRNRYRRVQEQAPGNKEGQIAAAEGVKDVTLEQATPDQIAKALSGVPPSEVARYDAELETYYQEYARYLPRLVSFQNRIRNTIKLDIWLANTGTAPAEDIDAFLHFPDGFILLDEENYPDEPKEPQPPNPPQSALEKMRQSIGYLTAGPPLRSLSSLSIPDPISSNVSPPIINRTHSYDVQVHIERVKQGLPECFDPLYLIFPTFASAQSFHIGYRLLAANVPTEITGELHVIVNKESDDPARA
jgi:hypothetical protein